MSQVSQDIASKEREAANQVVARRIAESDPVLVDVAPAGEVVSGMTPNTILTSGSPLDWEVYTEGQRNAILGGALFEGLATDPEDADRKIRTGEIVVSTCQDHACIGSMAGIYTASMPVFVVRDERHGNTAFCNLYEGSSHRRLNYGIYDDEVKRALIDLEVVYAPVLKEVVARSGGIPLRPMIARALRMGDEMHSRNTAATLLFTNTIAPYLMDMYCAGDEKVRPTLNYLNESGYFFLRLSMAASKVTADAAHGVVGSSVVTSMTINCLEFGIRVSGLGPTWFLAPIPRVEGKFFEGHSSDEAGFMGGESHINEAMGLGGFAQAAAFALQEYQGGSAEKMVEMNRAMYDITVAEHEVFKIPYFGFRGTPVGIDVYKVVESGIRPVIDAGVASKYGGQIGAGVMHAPLECFKQAVDEFEHGSIANRP